MGSGYRRPVGALCEDLLLAQVEQEMTKVQVSRVIVGHQKRSLMKERVWFIPG